MRGKRANEEFFSRIKVERSERVEWRTDEMKSNVERRGRGLE